jgi:hypothetical protein
MPRKPTKGGGTSREAAFRCLPPTVQADLRRVCPGATLRRLPTLTERLSRLGALAVLLDGMGGAYTVGQFLDMLYHPAIENWAEVRPFLERDLRNRAAAYSSRQRARLRSETYLERGGLDFASLPTFAVRGPYQYAEIVGKLAGETVLWLQNAWTLDPRDIYVPKGRGLPRDHPLRPVVEAYQRHRAGRLSHEFALVRTCVDLGYTTRRNRKPTTTREAEEAIEAETGCSIPRIRRMLTMPFSGERPC